MSPSNASTTRRLRSNSKAELAQQASAAEGTVKDKSTKRSKSSRSKSSGKKRKHQDSDSEGVKEEPDEFNDDDAKALKMLEKKREKALKKKEARRKGKVRDSIAALTMQEQSSDESEKSDGDVSPPKRKRIRKGRATDEQEMSSREDVDAEDQVDQRSERDHDEVAERSGGREGQGSGGVSSEDEMEDATSQSRRPPTSRRIRLDEGEANLAKSIGPPVVMPSTSPKTARARERIEAVELERRSNIKAGSKAAAKDKTPGKERSEQQKKPAWIATSVAEYNEREDHLTADEDDKLDSGGERRKDSSDEDVQVSTQIRVPRQ
ncbi:hypothetical protein FOMPIDRAFT_1056761 [Fomitopsis schrenkii]|uniref:Uncharacterized protein n=1 Tax=Fomitopsis schrenkii TaxID=2126942 RepID=S8DMJ2_FOMSC|nr:hypothetical protein FOMPIDRAFT_1056761 [Fomitopsis schrenkii]